jgi:penicillin-insensitive murein endopeptidase
MLDGWRAQILAVVLLLAPVLHFGSDLFRMFESAAPSNSIGTTSDGELENGKRLPARGENFVTYSALGSFLGRTCVHHEVRDVVLDAYDRVSRNRPDVQFTYGEAAWCGGGGPLRPHRTHQNGLSVDFMVPVADRDGQPATYPAWPWTRFGYAVEFDRDGNHADYRIDFDALAAHLLALREGAEHHGIRVRRVILAPDLRDELFAAEQGDAVRSRLTFMPGAAWVRHDEHYHVDFEL